jgi:hypothetical protein
MLISPFCKYLSTCSRLALGTIGLFLLLMPTNSHAQILPQQWAVGGIGSLGLERTGSLFSVSFFFDGQLEGLYFLSERWAVGAQARVEGRTGRLGFTAASFGPSARYYLRNQADRWQWYVGASPAYRRSISNVLRAGPPPVFEDIVNQELLLSGGLGASRFLGPSVLFDVQLNGLHPLPLGGSFQSTGNLSLLLGVMVLLPSAKRAP